MWAASVLRTYPAIQDCDVGASCNGNLVSTRSRVVHTSEIACPAKEIEDVGRVIEKVVSRIRLTADSPYETRAIAVQQSREETERLGCNDVCLPRLKRDKSRVFPAGTMLRKQRKPTATVGSDDCHRGRPNDFANWMKGIHSPHCLLAAFDHRRL